MEALGELAVAIFSAFLELLVHLIAAVLGSSFLAKHSKGMRRTFYIICAVSAFHLFLGLTLPILTDFNGYLLSPIFSGWAMLGAVVVLIVAFATITAINITDDAQAADDNTVAPPIVAPKLLIYVVAIIAVFGGASMLTVETKRTSLKDELCLAAAAKISPTWKDRGEGALALADKYLKRDLRGNLPCTKATTP